MTVVYYPLIERVIEKIVYQYVEEDADVKALTQGILDRQVVVELCEHGNVYRHMTGYQSNVRPEMQWCRGMP